MVLRVYYVSSMPIYSNAKTVQNTTKMTLISKFLCKTRHSNVPTRNWLKLLQQLINIINSLNLQMIRHSKFCYKQVTRAGRGFIGKQMKIVL